jgi:hypothetical protein
MFSPLAGGGVRPLAVVVALIAILAAAAPWPGAGRSWAEEVRADEVVLFLARNFSGPSKRWSLKPDQAFLAVPYTGDEFRPVSASIKLGADVGAVLFERPFFSSIDETCDYRLGTADDPRLWWRSDKVLLLPDPLAQGALEANLRPQEIASLIVYRRSLGPPPGALLLERRRYVNWDCQAPTKARGYKRLFVPVAAAPHRQGCFDLESALSYGGSGTVALDFSAASELLLLEPRDFDPGYADIDHQVTVALHTAKACAGAAASFPPPEADTRRFALKEFGLDRKARALTVRYEQGPYDPMLASLAPNLAEPADADARGTPGEPAPETDAETASETVPETASEAVAETVAGTNTGEAREAAPATAEVDAADAADAADAEATATAPQGGDPGKAETQVAAAGSNVAATDASTAAPGDGAPQAEAPQAEAPQAEAPQALQTPQTEVAETHAAGTETSDADTTEPAPNQGAPAAGESGQDEATGFLVLPESDSDAEDAARTFKFPLLQGYRLSACLYGREDCGEPAASEWCKARGFAGGATAFEIDENIGSLFPTLALGDLQLCASFICDGFKEITCQP